MLCEESHKQLAKNLSAELTFVPNAGHFNAKAGYLQFPDLLEKVDKILDPGSPLR